MNSQILITLLFTSIFIIACDKESIPVETSQQDEDFFVGQSIDGYTTKVFEPARQLCSINEHYPSLDLNFDEETDLVFSCNSYQSSGGYRLSESVLQIPNNDFEMLGDVRSDSVRVCYFYSLDSFQDTIWGKCFYNLPENRCSEWCSNVRPDSLAFLDTIGIARIFEKGDTLPTDREWFSGELILGYHNTSGHEPSLTADGEGQAYDILRGNFVNNSSGYLIFRYKDLDEFRYGWIHIDSGLITFIRSDGFSIEGIY